MRVCLMIEGQEGVTWEQWLALAETCEESGLEGLFRSDHYASVFDAAARGSLDAWATLAALAARTRRLRLGTLVSPVTFRHPSELARVVTTVDHVSGGRAELGLGAGWFEREHRTNGFPFPSLRKRLELLAEQLEIVHRVWTEDEVDFAGPDYALEKGRALPKPVQRPRPPLIVGGGALPGSLRPAVRFADEYNTFAATGEACRERRERLDRACEEGGRDPATLRLSVMVTCVVGSDVDELRERARAVLAVTGRPGDPDEALRDPSSRWLAGTTDQVIGRLRELAQAGAERVFLQHLNHADLESVRLIGQEIVPALS